MTRARSLWKFGGLSMWDLAKLTYKKMSADELSTRSAALSYYFLLALFPMLLFLLSLVAFVAGPGSQMRDTIVSAMGRLAPGAASSLIHGVVQQTFRASGGLKLAAGIVGALWAASGGMSAVVSSLNVIYRTTETRPWWKQKFVVVALTVALAVLIILALVLVLYGGKIGATVASHIGLGHIFDTAWDVVQWPVALGAMFMAFSLIYYFGPDVKNRTWHWVSPGAVTGVVLWLAASIGFRVYLHFFNRYSATYGSLGAVVILLLWLYFTGYAILIGDELNWVIENGGKEDTELRGRARGIQENLNAA